MTMNTQITSRTALLDASGTRESLISIAGRPSSLDASLIVDQARLAERIERFVYRRS
ncbi:hypothetical protein [Terrihabitans sp. B22-R8]|uniref:hypothetical protein n=1 Tax=Terrihabitans sp. B22-R8 TaxID=3425128 RepID=UPI00403CA4E9